MQDPNEGVMKELPEVLKDNTIDRSNPEKELENLKKAAKELESASGKPHPVFSVGETVEVKRGKFRVHKILKNRLVLKPIKY